MRRFLVFVPLAALLAACGGGKAIPADRMQRLVLRPPDVGRAFTPFYDNVQTHLDNDATPRSDPARDGREGGWVVRYRRPGSTATRGPLLVESRVDVFKSAGGAKDDLDLYKTMLSSGPGAARRALDVENLGDDATATTFLQAGGTPIRFFRIAWRYRNATASVTVDGFDGRLTAADAIGLARRQQQRLAHF
jgi:hypothetical protein